MTNNRLIELQFKILHDYVLTNKRLYKMNMIETSTCNYCDMYVQDIYHLLYDCFEVRNFWFELQSWYNRLNGCNYNFLKYDVFFGHMSKNENVDKLIFVAKYFIVTWKYKNEVPKVSSFKVFWNSFIYI